MFVPQTHQETARQVLVLPWRRPHVPVTRTPPLPQRSPGLGLVGGVGKNPRGVRVLLANPRWERRLLKFLELPGAGRVMDDGVDETPLTQRD